MFSKLAVLVTAAFAASAIAGPIDNSCNTGPVQCCDSLNSPSDKTISTLLGLLGVAVGDITAQVGIECNPITVIGVGSGANCATSPVCCTDVYSNSLVGINCTPINVGV